MITLTTHQPVHDHFSIRGLDGAARRINVTAIPITGLNDEFLVQRLLNLSNAPLH